jgi:hypothetical protein
MPEAIAPTDGGQGSAPAQASAAPSSSSAALAAPAAPAAPATPTSATISPPPAPAGPTAAIPWLDGVDETTLGYVANKGWQKPAELLNSYQNLEKLLGADKANNAVIIPKEGADPKEWQAVFDRLGRPTGPDGYKVAVPEGGDKALQDSMLKVAHELGLTKTQAEGLFTKFNETAVQSIQAQQQAKAAAFAQEDAAIKQEWGQAYTQNLAAAQAAARGLGLDSATIDKMSEGIGHKATMQLLAKIGSKMGEPDFVAGDNTERFSAALTPGQAKSAIQDKMADKEFVKLYTSGNKVARDEMARLHQYAYPD